MKYFIKLNIVSLIYSFMLFVSIELQLNYYRLWRLLNWEGEKLEIVLLGLQLVVFITLSLLLYFLTRKWLVGKWLRYWTMVLWLPYMVFFIMIFAYLFPITDRGDRPAPVQGLVIMAQVIGFPFYIGFLNLISQFTNTDIEG